MYQIIVYNHGKRYKKIKTYKTYSNALAKYKKVLEGNKVYFPRLFMYDHRTTDYELVLTAPPSNKPTEFIRNDLGAMVKLIPKGNFVIKKVSKYEIEETFTRKFTKEQYQFKDLIRFLLSKPNVTFVIIVINNKVVLEYFENEEMELFILKNPGDAYRLSETIKKFAVSNDIHDRFIFFQDPSMDMRIHIYDKLEEKYNVDRVFMHKITTH